MNNTNDSFINAPALKTASDWLQFSHIFKANIFLKDPNLWNVVREGNKVPEEDDAVDDSAQTKSDKAKLRDTRLVNDQKAMAILTKMVASTPKISLVIGKASCKEAFDALGAAFNRTSEVMIIHLSDEYRDHIIGNQSVTDYISNLSSIRNQLLSAKAEGYSDDSHVLKILRGLQSSQGVRDSRFENFYDMRMMWINEASLNPMIKKPTIESIIAGLLDVELLKTKTPALHKPKIAATTTQEKQGGIFRGKCFKCFQKGHKSNDPFCPKYKVRVDKKIDGTPTNSKQTTSNETPVKHVSFKQATTAVETTKHSLVASKSVVTKQAIKFILDSGASEHMVPDDSMLNDFKLNRVNPLLLHQADQCQSRDKGN
jgi:hypothetical protein